MQTYAFFSDYVWLVNINSLFYPSFASFHKRAGRFSNKPCLHRKEALFTSQTSLVCNQKKPSLQPKQAFFTTKRSLVCDAKKPCLKSREFILKIKG